MSSLLNMIMGRTGNSGQLLTKQQRAKSRQNYEKKLQRQAKERKDIKQKAEKYIKRVSDKQYLCHKRYMSYDDWMHFMTAARPSDFQCEKLPSPDTLRTKSQEEVIEIYQKYQQQIKNHQMAQNRKKQQRIKRIENPPIKQTPTKQKMQQRIKRIENPPIKQTPTKQKMQQRIKRIENPPIKQTPTKQKIQQRIKRIENPPIKQTPTKQKIQQRIPPTMQKIQSVD